MSSDGVGKQKHERQVVYYTNSLCAVTLFGRHASGTDNYEAIMDCFETKGIANCKDMGTVWLNQTVEKTPW